MPGSQWHLDSCNQFIWRKVQWFGLQETLIWAITAPQCHPPLPFCVSQLCPVNDRKSSAWGQHYKHTLLRGLKRQLNRAEKDKLVFIFSSIFSLIFCYSLSTLSSLEYFWSNRSLPSPTPHASESSTQNPALAEGRLTFCPLIFMIYLKAGPILFLFERSNLPLALGKKTTKGKGTEISFKSF